LTCSLASTGSTIDLGKYPNGLNDDDKAKVDEMIINITNTNTDALTSAVDNMQFNNIDQVRGYMSRILKIILLQGPICHDLWQFRTNIGKLLENQCLLLLYFRYMGKWRQIEDRNLFSSEMETNKFYYLL
jgi:hypothetical protein